MKKKLIITESQLARLKQSLVESSEHAKIVETMKKELDANYEVSNTFVREGGEYSDSPMIKVKIDEELITPKALYEYLRYKYKKGRKFTEQVIRDWVDNKISDNYMLSKNVPLN